MGQAESQQVNPDQVTGFNPDVNSGTRASGRRRRRQEGKIGVRNKAQEDVFFQYADVTEHIRPIYEEVQRPEAESLDDDVDGHNVNLTKLLGELGIKKTESNESEGLVDFPDQGTESSVSSDDDDEDRGLFHHEQKHQEKSEPVSVLSVEAHPISVKGDCSVGEKLRMVDGSTWAAQYPVYKVQWHLGAEIGTQVTFNTVPEAEGTSLTIPPSAVGRYIQVTATRRVEDQIRGTYGGEVEGGLYDPHVEKAKFVETGTERKFTDVVSVTIVGPVLIPDGWAYAIIKALMEGEFRCFVKLRDEETLAVANEEVFQQDGKMDAKGRTLQKVPALMTINYSRIRFEYEMSHDSARKEGASSLFSLEWLSRQLFGDKSGDTKTAQSNANSSLTTVELKFRTVVCRPSESKRTIVLALKPKKKGFSHTQLAQDLIRFDVDPSVGRDVLLYILMGFQAATVFKEGHCGIWQRVFESGEVEKGKDLIQEYLELLTSTVHEDTPAYEEMPVSPWDY